MARHREFKRVRGLVVVMEKDRRGRITRIGLRTPHDEEYLVLDTPIAEFMRDFIGEEVVVNGEIILDDGVVPSLRAYGFDPVQMDDPAVRDWVASDFDGLDEEWN